MNKGYKITVNTPTGVVDNVVSAISEIFPPFFGEYKDVFWLSSPGVEQFKPLSRDNPGYGLYEKGESIQISFIVPRDKELVARIVSDAIKPAHPWEEPVIVIEKCLASGKLNRR